MSDALDNAVDALRSVLPPGRVSTADADRLAVSVDLWPRHLIRLAAGERAELPAAVVWPESTDEVRVLVRAARAQGMGLVAYGAGSSVVGGATPTASQVVVDFKRMARVLEIDTDGLTATAEAGIHGELFERQLERRGFTQGHFPSSIYCSTLGGWIAARSAGQMSSRYGKIEDQVVGGRVVLGDGSLLVQRPSPVRAPLFDAMVGAEGALGLWAEATVRIHPLPEARAWRGFVFPDLVRALSASRAWLDAGLNLNVIRIYDPLDTFLHRQTHVAAEPRDLGPSRLAWLGATFPRLTSWFGDRLSAGCRCIVGVQGSKRSVDVEMAEAIDIAAHHSAQDLGAGPGEAWYEHRYAVSYGQSRAFRAGVVVDTMEVACPWDRVLAAYRAVRRAALAQGVQVLAHFSHLYLEGGSIYFTFAMPIGDGAAGYDRLWSAVLRAAQRAGANVSHHHGTGRLKADALAAALGGATATLGELQRDVDPDRTLNPELLRLDASHATPRERRTIWRATSAPGQLRGRPDDTVAAAERALQADGRTLGPVADLFPSVRLIDAARRRWLLGVNSQLRVIESLVMGVDARIDGRAHWVVPAPRAAMGPEMTTRLLEADVDALWLRSDPRRTRRLTLVGPLPWAVSACRAIATDDGVCGARLQLVGSKGRWHIEALLPEGGERGDLAAARIRRQVDPAKGASVDAGPGGLVPMPPEPLAFAGPWRTVLALLRAAQDEGVRCVVPWVDAVGAAGFLVAGDGGQLDAEHSGRLQTLVDELGLSAHTDRSTGVAQLPEDEDRTDERGVVGEAPRVALDLPSHVGALDNCTYCPKLCRFSCPVSVADGSETLTPRQLMLTTAMHLHGKRSLGADSASRLWACADCRGCTSFCAHGNDVAGALIEARHELTRASGAPERVRNYLASFRVAGGPPDLIADDNPADGLRGDGEPSATHLFLGCQGTRTDMEPALAALAISRRHFGSVHVASGELSCCGHPLWRWGDRDAFGDHARRFAAQFAGAERIVVDDPGCAYALRVLYPEAGVEVPPVVTTTALLREESWQVQRPEAWALHDDSYALRWLREPPLRELDALKALQLPPGSVLEGTSGCCGGMLTTAYDEELGQRVARGCADDLLDGGAQRVLTASPSCRRRLRSAGVEVDDLLAVWQRSVL